MCEEESLRDSRAMLQVAAVADLAFAENAAAVQAGFTVTLQASFFGASGTVMQFTETADACG